MRKLVLLAAVVSIAACDRSKPELEKTLVQVQTDLGREGFAVAGRDGHHAVHRGGKHGTVEGAHERERQAEGRARGRERREAVAETSSARSCLHRIKGITASLNEADSRLAASRKRVAMLDTNNAGLKSQLAAYDSTMTSFKAIIENQKAQVLDLTAQVNALTTENTELKAINVQLTTDKTNLTDERNKLTTEKNTVYYVIGTKDELLKKNIIVQTGGMLGIGKVQVACARSQPRGLHEHRQDDRREHPAPGAGKSYKHRDPRQDVAGLETPPDTKGRLHDAIKIKDPVAFWAASKYLIVIEQ